LHKTNTSIQVIARLYPIRTDEEPHHHVLFKNELVIVLRATLRPGESTLYHTHFHDSADVELLASTTTEQLFGKEEGPQETSQAGEVSVDSLNRPITHRVHNVGKSPMDIFHVEFLQRPAQPSARAAAPSARVYNWILAPGVTAPIHTHQRPYLVVVCTGMRLNMSAQDGHLQEVNAGDFYWTENDVVEKGVGDKVTHALANQGAAQGQIVEIELK
jgi:hypothetical protein